MMTDPFLTDLEQGKLFVKRFALARAAVIAVVAILCAVVHVRSGAGTNGIGTKVLAVILFVALVESLIVTVWSAGARRPTTRIMFLLLCADLALITAIVVLTGVSSSAFAFLYIAAILWASILFSFNWSIIIASISSALFLISVILEYNGHVVVATAFAGQKAFASTEDLWAFTAMKIFAFYLVAFLSGYLSHRIGLLQSFQHDVINSFSSGFLSVNRDGVVTFLNAAGSRLLMRSRPQCIGQPVSSVFPVQAGTSNPLEEVVVNKKECQGKEINVRRGDGKLIPVGITVSALKKNDRRPTGAIASFIDLTELKRMEEKLRRTDRLAAVGEMSESLAHEIRNPVASIRGAVQELTENLRLEGIEGRLAEIAVRESDQLQEIISRFLEFVGTGKSVSERFNVADLLKEAIRSAERHPTLNGSIRIVGEVSDDLGCMTGDRARVREAISNILRNGIEATFGGGTIRVTARVDEVSPENVRIVVADEGCGIPANQMDRLFDPFFTTKPDGVGLGMAIAHRVVSLHEGTIDVESLEHTGTTVTITLPREV